MKAADALGTKRRLVGRLVNAIDRKREHARCAAGKPEARPTRLDLLLDPALAERSRR